MENPEVIVSVTTIKPTSETVVWSNTDEGSNYMAQLIDHYISYGEDIDLSIRVSSDGLTTETIVKYKTKEIYEESRKKILLDLPDFYEKKAEYDTQNQIIHIQDVHV
jgi:hypothetical protein